MKWGITIKKHVWSFIYGTILTAFTIYVILDTFVITRVYTDVASNETEIITVEQEKTLDETSLSEKNFSETSDTQSNSDNVSKEKADDTSVTSSEPQISNNTYTDDNISITLTQYRKYDTNIYVADVTLSSAEYLQTALAKSSFGKNVTERTSDISKECDAILAINGDYYGAQEKGYVMRNGTLYRDTASKDNEDLVIYKDGSFGIIEESEVSATDASLDDAEQILSFGPALVENGEISVTEDAEVGREKASNPRTAIAVVDDLHYLFVVSDGRTQESDGLSLYELASFCQSLGGQTVYNLDGGGSTTMYFNGEVINKPTTDGRKIEERKVSDIVFIGY